jgi:hypothetical protein
MIPEADIVARAKSQIGLKTVYMLGHGGMRPDQPMACDGQRMCDCSGFAAWVLGVSRKTDNPYYKAYNGGWIETTAITRDAKAVGVGMFDLIAWNRARPGDLLVWGDHDGHQGHVGIITQIDETGPKWITHCSLGNFKALGDAISQTDVGIFRRNNAIAARCAWVQHEAA